MAQRVARGRATSAPRAEPEAPAPVQDPRRALVALGAVLVLLAAGGAALAGAAGNHVTGPLARCHLARETAPREYAGPPAPCISAARGYYADVITTRGHFAFVMPAGTAPNTVNNFVALAANGFYNGLTFNRVEDWVAQGGDPLGTGAGGPGYNLPDEVSSGEWVPGAVGMARYPNGPVNGSQFFVLRSAWPGTGPGGLTFNRFGTIVVGLDIVQQLTRGDRIINLSVKPS